MQAVDLPLECHMFYCPVTGVPVLGGPNGIEASPAVLVMYSQEGSKFNAMHLAWGRLMVWLLPPEMVDQDPA